MNKQCAYCGKELGMMRIKTDAGHFCWWECWEAWIAGRKEEENG